MCVCTVYVYFCDTIHVDGSFCLIRLIPRPVLPVSRYLIFVHLCALVFFFIHSGSIRIECYYCVGPISLTQILYRTYEGVRCASKFIISYHLLSYHVDDKTPQCGFKHQTLNYFVCAIFILLSDNIYKLKHVLFYVTVIADMNKSGKRRM